METTDSRPWEDLDLSEGEYREMAAEFDEDCEAEARYHARLAAEFPDDGLLPSERDQLANPFAADWHAEYTPMAPPRTLKEQQAHEQKAQRPLGFASGHHPKKPHGRS